MKIYVISDNIDTLTGLRLAGVGGVVVHEKKEFEDALKNVDESNDIAVLLITQKLAKKFPESLVPLKMSKKLPLIVEIPDRHGSEGEADSITKYVREAIGVKM